jgi:carbamoyltransferase
MKIIWGINILSHDSSLSVLKNNEIVFASSSERFSKIKNDSNLNQEIINYALNFGYPDKIILSEKNYLKNIRKILFGQSLKINPQKHLESFGLNNYDIDSVYHHEAHAAAGYFTSNFNSATILIVNAIGEWDTISIWKAERSKLKKIYYQIYPNSIGLFYSAMTQRIGLKPNEEEYILMALAAYGDKNKFKSEMIDLFFDSYNQKIKLKYNLHKGCLWWKPELTEKDFPDIAAATQSIYEDFLTNILSLCKTKNKNNNLIFGGGCALNCYANRILYQFYDNVHIFFNPGDSGNSIGAILSKERKHIKCNSPFLGYEIKNNIKINNVINELNKNKICGIAHGKAEFGPRALGNRSLLGDPRDLDIINKINLIKQRQLYRPFAISILKDFSSKYFNMYNNESPYMQYTYEGNDKNIEHLLHINKTSRIQTVDKNNPFLYNLLIEWYKKTDLPYLINTSLNIKGQPIINDESDTLNFQKLYNIKVL